MNADTLPPTKPLDFVKTLDLFTGRLTQDLIERQVSALDKVWKKSQNGLKIKDLPHIQELLIIVSDRVRDGKAALVEPLCRTISLCSVPFVKEKAAEEVLSFEALCGATRTVGTLLACPDPNVQLQACKTLSAMAHLSRGELSVKVKDNAADEDAARKFLSPNSRVMEKSGVVEMVVAALKGDICAPVKLAVVKCLRDFSYFQELACQVTAANGLETLVSLLQTDFQRDGLFIVIEVLWNILEHDPEAKVVMGTWHAVNLLKELLTTILLEGYRVKHKEIRNEVLIIATLLAHHEGNRKYFFETGFLELLLVFSTAAETNLQHDAVKSFVLTVSNEDFEMKKWMWNLVSVCSSHAQSVAMIAQKNFMEVLLTYLDSSSDRPNLPKWSATQLHDLQAQALGILFHLVPSAPCTEEFLRLNGCAVLLNLLVTSGSDNQLRQGALTVLLVTAAMEGFAKDLGSLGAIRIMLDLVSDAKAPWMARQDAIAILAELCGHYDHNKVIFGKEGGVTVLKSLLRWRDGEGGFREQLLLSAIDCVWTAVVNQAANESRFLASDGVASLLDLLECCPELMRYQILSCLADLLQNQKAVALFCEWRSQSAGITAVELLLRMWMTEELKAGLVTSKGVLADASHPLDGTLASELRKGSPKIGSRLLDRSFRKSSSFSLLSNQDMKMKIIAIFSKIGFDKAEGLDTRLTVSLAMIERYTTFQEGELWRQIAQELRDEGIRPITPDRLRLEARIEEAESAALQLMGVQDTLVNEQEQQALSEEQHFYKGFIENVRRQEEEKKKSKLTKSVNLAARQEAKQRKAEMLKHSRMHYVEPLPLQAVDDENKSVTTSIITTNRSRSDGPAGRRNTRHTKGDMSVRERTGDGHSVRERDNSVSQRGVGLSTPRSTQSLRHGVNSGAPSPLLNGRGGGGDSEAPSRSRTAELGSYNTVY